MLYASCSCDTQNVEDSFDECVEVDGFGQVGVEAFGVGTLRVLGPAEAGERHRGQFANR